MMAAEDSDETNDQSQLASVKPATKYLKLKEVNGDIFSAAPRSMLLHACNCKGSWGAGIAAAFRTRYPRAYESYKSHCARNNPATLVGTAYLIAPVDDENFQHFIGCLFTSVGFGKSKDTPSQILLNTELAMKDMLKQRKTLEDNQILLGDIQMCRINSGYFKVPWRDTKTTLEAIEIDKDKNIEISVISKM